MKGSNQKTPKTSPKGKSAPKRVAPAKSGRYQKPAEKVTPPTVDKGGRPRTNGTVWPIYESKKQAAEAIPCPIASLTRAQRAGAPGFRHGRVYMLELCAWMLSQDPDGDATDWSQALNKERTLRERIRRGEDEFRILDREEAEEKIKRLIAIHRGNRRRFYVDELPAQAEGLKAIEIRALAAKTCDQADADLERQLLALAMADEKATDEKKS